jgi:hypothetical protein
MSKPNRLTALDRQLLRDLRRVAKTPAQGHEGGLRALRYRVLAPDGDENWASERLRAKGVTSTATRLDSLLRWRRLSSRAEADSADGGELFLTDERLLRLHVSAADFVQAIVDLEDDLSDLFDIAPGGHAAKGTRWRRPDALD